MDSSLLHRTSEDRERWLVEALGLRRVIVTRGGVQGEALVSRLNELGATALHVPTISFAPPNNAEPLREAVFNIAENDWVVFTSANAVQAVAEQIVDMHDGSNVALPAIAAVGQATAAAVRAHGWDVQFVATRGGGLALATDLPVSAGDKILLPRADIASAELPNVLRDRDCVVHEVVAYRTLSNQAIHLPVDYQDSDALTFTSPSTVSAFVAAAKSAGWNLQRDQQRGRLTIACIGDTTARAVQQHGLIADAVAAEQSSEGLIDALADALRQRIMHATP